MTTIADLETVRRRRNGDAYLEALRLRDIPACREIVARHQAETAELENPVVGPVRPARPRYLRRPLLAQTHGSAEGSEPA